MLAHLLLGWKLDDFAFREIAFTILCLASGRQNVSIVESLGLVDDDAHGCANLTNRMSQEDEPEFVAHMGVGAHLNANAAGSAPQSTIYWFEGVLVHLVAQLDRPDAITQSVARVVQRTRESCPWQPVDAVLISIAHVVLVRVIPDSKVQHTKPLPLFFFSDQPSQDLRERFSPSEVEVMLQRKEWVTAKRTARDERNRDALKNGDNVSEEWDSECDERGAGSISTYLLETVDLTKTYRNITKTEPSFFALALLFDASKRAPKPLLVAARSFLPIEIYRMILSNVQEVETFGACMAVSSNFREICTQSSSIVDGLTVLPNEATKAYTYAQDVWNDEQPRCYRPEHIRRWKALKATEPGLEPGVRVVEQATSSKRDITIDRVIRGKSDLMRIRPAAAYGKTWRVVVGRTRHRRSVLVNMCLAFRDVER